MVIGKTNDSHLHIGYLSDDVIVKPKDIKIFMERHSVSCGAVMPTASIGGYDNFLFHISLYKEAANEGLFLILYVSPHIIKYIKDNEISEIEDLCIFRSKTTQNSPHYFGA